MLNWFFLLPFQNKEFVYRGQEWEKISTFTQRLASEFPHAQVLTSNSREPDQSLKSEDGQFVQVGITCPVKVYFFWSIFVFSTKICTVKRWVLHLKSKLAILTSKELYYLHFIFKDNTVNFWFKHVRFKEVFQFKEEFHCSQNFST